MRAITIWQPWAELIVMGYKLNETRSWATTYTGPIAIHAAKYRKLPHEVYAEIAAAIGITPEGYRGSWLYYLEHGVPAESFGAVLGTATLGRVLPTTLRATTPREKALGDFTPDRFAWPLYDVARFDKPIPAKGKQGLWTWDPPTPADTPARGSE